MPRGFIGNFQKEAKRQNSVNPKLSLEQPASATTDTPSDKPATDEQPKKKKWVMPVLIGVGVIVVGILTYVLLKRKK